MFPFSEPRSAGVASGVNDLFTRGTQVQTPLPPLGRVASKGLFCKQSLVPVVVPISRVRYVQSTFSLGLDFFGAVLGNRAA